MSKTIHQWKRFALVEEEIELPTRTKVTHTTVVHPGATVILPILPDGKVLLLRQFRPSIGDWLYELPAGTIELNENSLQCAKRELEEETGFSGLEFQSLGELIPLAGFCDETQFLYIARELKKTDRYQCDEDEVIEVLSYEISQIEQMVINGNIVDSKTIACLSKAKLCGYI